MPTLSAADVNQVHMAIKNSKEGSILPFVSAARACNHHVSVSWSLMLTLSTFEGNKACRSTATCLSDVWHLVYKDQVGC